MRRWLLVLGALTAVPAYSQVTQRGVFDGVASTYQPPPNGSGVATGASGLTLGPLGTPGAAADAKAVQDAITTARTQATTDATNAAAAAVTPSVTAAQQAAAAAATQATNANAAAAAAQSTATAAQTAAASAKGVVQSDGSISLPVVDATGAVTTRIIPAANVTAPTLAAFPTPLTLTHAMGLTTSQPGAIISYAEGGLPGETLTMTDSLGVLTLTGIGIRSNSASLPTGNDAVNLTRHLAGYTDKTETFTIALVSPARTGAPVVLSNYVQGSPVFQDAFTSAPNIWTPSNTSATWRDYYHQADPEASSFYYGSGRTNTTGETQEFGSPLVDGYNPFEPKAGGGVAIVATPVANAPAGAHPFIPGATHLSGTLEYRDMPDGTEWCSETRASVEAKSGVWPAFWFYPRPGVSNAEDDVFEFGWLSPLGFNRITQYKHPTPGNGGFYNEDTGIDFYNEWPESPNLTQVFHTFLTCHWNNYVMNAVDGRITTSMVQPASWKDKTDPTKTMHMDARINLSIGSGSILPVGNWTKARLFVDYFKIWNAKPQTVQPPVGAPRPPDAAYMAYNYNNVQTLNITGVTYGEAVTGYKGIWRVAGTTTWPDANKTALQAASNYAPWSNPNVQVSIGNYPTNQNLEFGAVQSNGVTDSAVTSAGAIYVVSSEARPAAAPANALIYDDFARADVAPASPTPVSPDPTGIKGYSGSPLGISSHRAVFATGTGGSYQTVDPLASVIKYCATMELGSAGKFSLTLHQGSNGYLSTNFETGVTSYNNYSTATAVGTSITPVTSGNHVACMQDTGAATNNLTISVDGVTVMTATYTQNAGGTQVGWTENSNSGTIRLDLLSVVPASTSTSGSTSGSTTTTSGGHYLALVAGSSAATSTVPLPLPTSSAHLILQACLASALPTDSSTLILANADDGTRVFNWAYAYNGGSGGFFLSYNLGGGSQFVGFKPPTTTSGCYQVDLSNSQAVFSSGPQGSETPDGTIAAPGVSAMPTTNFKVGPGDSALATQIATFKVLTGTSDANGNVAAGATTVASADFTACATGSASCAGTGGPFTLSGGSAIH